MLICTAKINENDQLTSALSTMFYHVHLIELNKDTLVSGVGLLPSIMNIVFTFT